MSLRVFFVALDFAGREKNLRQGFRWGFLREDFFTAFRGKGKENSSLPWSESCSSW
jgi:hypothetical protein